MPLHDRFIALPGTVILPSVLSIGLAVFASAFAILWLSPSSALAMPMPAATVEAVQAPAWLDRNGTTRPLAAGMEIKNGDILRTGEGARAYLMLAEGSRVKLAESARFVFHSRSLNPAKRFRGALDVAAGAFRYTAGSSSKASTNATPVMIVLQKIAGCPRSDMSRGARSDGKRIGVSAPAIDRMSQSHWPTSKSTIKSRPSSNQGSKRLGGLP